MSKAQLIAKYDACRALLAKVETYKPTTLVSRVKRFLPLSDAMGLEYPDYASSGQTVADLTVDAKAMRDETLQRLNGIEKAEKAERREAKDRAEKQERAEMRENKAALDAAYARHSAFCEHEAESGIQCEHCLPVVTPLRVYSVQYQNNRGKWFSVYSKPCTLDQAKARFKSYGRPIGAIASRIVAKDTLGRTVQIKA